MHADAISTLRAIRALTDAVLHEDPLPTVSHAEPEPEPEGLASRGKTANVFGFSLSTLDRLCRDGCPYLIVGTRRRFDLAQVRAWFAARGSKPTTPEGQIDPEVARLARASGLRVARGAR